VGQLLCCRLAPVVWHLAFTVKNEHLVVVALYDEPFVADRRQARPVSGAAPVRQEMTRAKILIPLIAPVGSVHAEATMQIHL
jgi:hypothetical protein